MSGPDDTTPRPTRPLRGYGETRDTRHKTSPIGIPTGAPAPVPPPPRAPRTPNPLAETAPDPLPDPPVETTPRASTMPSPYSVSGAIPAQSLEMGPSGAMRAPRPRSFPVTTGGTITIADDLPRFDELRETGNQQIDANFALVGRQNDLLRLRLNSFGSYNLVDFGIVVARIDARHAELETKLGLYEPTRDVLEDIRDRLDKLEEADTASAAADGHNTEQIVALREEIFGKGGKGRGDNDPTVAEEARYGRRMVAKLLGTIVGLVVAAGGTIAYLVHSGGVEKGSFGARLAAVEKAREHFVPRVDTDIRDLLMKVAILQAQIEEIRARLPDRSPPR